MGLLVVFAQIEHKSPLLLVMKKYRESDESITTVDR